MCNVWIYCVLCEKSIVYNYTDPMCVMSCLLLLGLLCLIIVCIIT